jgi:general secretion pathway protein D
MTEYRAYEVIQIIQETIDPESWYDAGGEGQIYAFGGTKLIVWQTPDTHEKIRRFFESMKELVGQQVAIETRFLLVDENFLEDIGFGVNIRRLKVGGLWGTEGALLDISQGSFSATEPSSTGISSSLGGSMSYGTQDFDGVGSGPGLQMRFGYGDVLDDLIVNFMIRATQAHANSKALTAPKIMVLNGESGTIQVIKERTYVANISLSSDTATTVEGSSFAVPYFEQEIDTLLTGIVLNVTPTITSDKKYVILRITTALTKELDSNVRKDIFTQVIGSETGTDQTVGWEQPITEYTSIQTRAVVPDRGTVLLGGLTLTAEKEIEAGVPILSKLPLLGRLFSNRSEVKDKQVLLVLVKPTIILMEEAEEAAIAAMN